MNAESQNLYEKRKRALGYKKPYHNKWAITEKSSKSRNISHITMKQYTSLSSTKYCFISSWKIHDA